MLRAAIAHNAALPDSIVAALLEIYQWSLADRTIGRLMFFLEASGEMHSDDLPSFKREIGLDTIGYILEQVRNGQT